MLKNILTGTAMGIAEVIPGVSGGTIAFITGIYERLLDAIKSFSPALLKVYKKDGFAGVWQKIDGLFLVQLFFGMAVGIVVGIFAITWILENHPLFIWSFFFGLIIASSIYVARQIHVWGGLTIVLIVLGIIVSYWITIATPATGSSAPLVVYLSGAVAICALILPGLSGSFILLLLGMYQVVIPAVKETLKLNFDYLVTTLSFALGCLTGVIAFSNLLSWTFKKYKNQTLAILTGFMIGSLNKVWPWQQVLSVKTSDKGEVAPAFTKSVMPSTFDQLTEYTQFYGEESQVLLCIVFMIIGFVAVFGAERLANEEDAGF